MRTWQERSLLCSVSAPAETSPMGCPQPGCQNQLCVSSRTRGSGRNGMILRREMSKETRGRDEWIASERRPACQTYEALMEAIAGSDPAPAEGRAAGGGRINKTCRVGWRTATFPDVPFYLGKPLQDVLTCISRVALSRISPAHIQTAWVLNSSQQIKGQHMKQLFTHELQKTITMCLQLSVQIVY